MKSISSLFRIAARAVLSVLFLGVLGTTHLHAQELFAVGDFLYQLNGDGVSATLVCHVDASGVSGELSLPTNITYNGNNYTVTRIQMG